MKRICFSKYNLENLRLIVAKTAALQSLLGHSMARITTAYTHPLEQAKREAMERVSSILFPIVPLMFPTKGEQENGEAVSVLN